MPITLNSPGVSLSVQDVSQYAVSTGATTPLFIFATRSGKTLPDGTGTAPGTLESNVLRNYASQRDILQSLGTPLFVTSGGVSVDGHEANEYGLHAMWSMSAIVGSVYGIRADIDMGGLIPRDDAPVGTPADGTYWIDTSDTVGGIFRRSAANTSWETVPFSVFTEAPTSEDGADGDWAFDYSDSNGTLSYKDSDGWTNYAPFSAVTPAVPAAGSISFSAQPAPSDTFVIGATTFTFVAASPTAGQVLIGANLSATLVNAASVVNGSAAGSLVVATSTASALQMTALTAGTSGNTIAIAADGDTMTPSGANLSGGTAAAGGTVIGGRAPTTTSIWVSDTAPTGARANDYWWKTARGSGGLFLDLKSYRASDNTWVPITVSRGATAPFDVTGNTVWEDTSSLLADGSRPLMIGNGATFVPLPTVVQSAAPFTSPDDGTLWFSDDITDFAMYVESSNAWVPVETVTVSTPAANQKVISANAPAFPSVGAIWVDVSPANVDAFPVVKRWSGASWEDLSASVTISDTYTAPALVLAGTYWINLGDPRTQNTLKVYDSTYEPPVLDEDGELESSDPASHGHWMPYTGPRFGRRSTRYAVVRALQGAISGNDDIRSETVRYQIIAAPGYPELYDEILTLVTDIGNIAVGIADTPARMVPSGVPAVGEITATDWKTNANGATSTGEDGFASSGSAYMAMYYPWGMSTNVDGSNVMVPPSTMAMRTIAYSDSIGQPFFAAMGESAGLVANATAVGYLSGLTGTFKTLNLKQGQNDILYDLDINPIVNLFNVGLRVWGQKTTYGSATALDRLNVGRLLAKMQYDLKISFRAFIGKPADPITWASAKNLADKYLAGLKGLRGLVDYASRCDGENNTADRVNRNEMWVDIAIIPEKSVEFIYVPITVYEQGASLTQ